MLRDQLAETRPWGITGRSEPVRLPELGKGERVEAGLAGGGIQELERKAEQGGEWWAKRRGRHMGKRGAEGSTQPWVRLEEP